MFYIKDNKSVLVDLNNSFIYEVSAYLYHKQYFSLIGKKYFSSPKEIENIIESFYINKNIEICCELYKAPEKWLIKNNYEIWVKPIKKSSMKYKLKNNDLSSL